MRSSSRQFLLILGQTKVSMTKNSPFLSPEVCLPMPINPALDVGFFHLSAVARSSPTPPLGRPVRPSSRDRVRLGSEFLIPEPASTCTGVDVDRCVSDVLRAGVSGERTLDEETGRPETT